jgi:hypothetical protein
MVRRLPLAAFAALAVATVAAFFVTQHLKVSTPLLAGLPKPFPSVINPVGGGVCSINGPHGPERISFREMKISFYLQNRSDSVDVAVVNPSGAVIATIGRGRYMRAGPHPVRTQFAWDGREDNGQIAPEGIYYVRVTLIREDRTVEISNPAGVPQPITVKTRPPEPVITSVAPARIPSATTAVRIHYRGNGNRGGLIRIYRVQRSRRLALVDSFPTPGRGSTATWDGLIRHRRAPRGTYVIGLVVTDNACTTGRFPPTLSSVGPDVAAAEVTVG